MLERLLSSVIVQLLTRLGKALFSALVRAVRVFRRNKEQKKAIDELQKKTDAGASRDDKRQAEEDYINS